MALSMKLLQESRDIPMDERKQDIYCSIRCIHESSLSLYFCFRLLFVAAIFIAAGFKFSCTKLDNILNRAEVAATEINTSFHCTHYITGKKEGCCSLLSMTASSFIFNPFQLVSAGMARKLEIGIDK